MNVLIHYIYFYQASSETSHPLTLATAYYANDGGPKAGPSALTKAMR